ncbi:metal-dependent hydrolase [Bacillus lacus]|uniref:Metal-dependent hydrolase n=1 Tax=Metabacillus lacus TaxID=1983721 RepID=A0A7X2LYF1_9BACI|nr:metal-dependent hydrolase [Metabacillus lacus]MRX72276.1 metal-dependent hydrolase [Metabacillus lacus]
MDTITHTLFGLGIYAAVDKRDMKKHEKRALLLTVVAGSQIPDIDVISRLWDYNGQYQMWHRGLTHSVFLVPLWGALLYWVSKMIFRHQMKKLLWIGMLSVFIHITSDVLNAWGTGYLEPFSQIRLSLGTVPIVDFVIWAVFLAAFLCWRMGRTAQHLVFRIAWAVILLHVSLQTLQGAYLLNTIGERYEQAALSAEFLPWHYTIVAKSGKDISIGSAAVWKEYSIHTVLESNEDADLSPLYAQNPRAAALNTWSPFVVVVENGNRLGIYDPRFYRNGESFLYEYIDK